MAECGGLACLVAVVSALSDVHPYNNQPFLCWILSLVEHALPILSPDWGPAAHGLLPKHDPWSLAACTKYIHQYLLLVYGKLLSNLCLVTLLFGTFHLFSFKWLFLREEGADLNDSVLSVIMQLDVRWPNQIIPCK